ncbi:MAG TPA: uridine diphosphate-N-acetylglucosamine-binding protein YvcK [Actinobacteria bacterium]|nr:uridine diphosphate-N-acetylglucosamine-binding protein YvcK [Actinomycetota bacterium]HDL49090.1 uridine diphosphate-N-acetylglucosamine-binding protein YvcK [Actinomycetota bacterium]
MVGWPGSPGDRATPRHGTMILPEVALDPLGLDVQGPNVVAIGGGHGLAQVLEGVQVYAGDIVAIVTVADDGGSSGRLTSTLAIPPPGDIRKCLLALSPEPSIWRELFSYRFDTTDVAGHSLGNLMLAALQDVFDGDFPTAVRVAGSLLGARGEVIPVAPRSLHLRAEIDGRWVDGQAAIARTRGTIRALCLEPDDESASADALRAIRMADQVILGPGSLFTSLISALMVPGIVEAIDQASGRLIFVANLTTQDGETLSLDGIGHLAALQQMTGLTRTGVIVAHHGDLDVPEPVRQLEYEAEEVETFGWHLVEEDLADVGSGWPQHDPIKLGKTLGELV